MGKKLGDGVVVLSSLSIFAVLFSLFPLLSASASAVSYRRPPPLPDVFVNLSEDQDSTSPQQVHISVVGEDRMRITWITDSPTPSTVYYGTSLGNYSSCTNGTSSAYTYFTYHSGHIHDVVVGPLIPNSLYYYRCGSSDSGPKFSFKTPPARFPINFVVVGDLGQTGWTKTTLQRISQSNYDMLLLPGDLSCADCIQTQWDSFGRLVEPLASQRPWMVTQGNHEVEKIPIIHTDSFTAYNARWRMPFQECVSPSNLYYSFDVAGVHVVMLGSYADFDPGSEQYNWVKADLGQVDRGKTPWIVMIFHAPWYNSNTAHQGESESVLMKKYLEGLVYQARVDVVFAGHVHAYERFNRVYEEKGNNCGPVHITIGDGGNREGLARKYMNPKPKISAFREASFGHGQFQVVNATHALWTWHRNDNNSEAIASDSIWLASLSSNPSCKP